jgi:2'-5' RNA ligase
MRLFLGFDPSGAERAIYGLCQRLDLADGPPLRWIPPENWHVTLVFLGDVPERSLERLITTVEPVVDRSPAIAASLVELQWFPSALKPRMLTLRVDAPDTLARLHAAVSTALRREGFHSEHRAYRPHLTLARLKGSRKLVAPPPLPPIAPIAAELGELVLFESQPNEQRYNPLQRFGLAA